MPKWFLVFLLAVILLPVGVFANKAGYFAQDDPDRVTESKYLRSVQYYDKATGLFEKKDYKSALSIYHSVVTNDPYNYKAFYYLARCEYEEKAMKEAVLHLYRSDQLHPQAWVKAEGDRLLKKLSDEDKDWVSKNFSTMKKWIKE